MQRLRVEWGGPVRFPLGWRRIFQRVLRFFGLLVIAGLAGGAFYRAFLIWSEETRVTFWAVGPVQSWLATGFLALFFLLYFLFYRYHPLAVVRSAGRVRVWDVLETRLRRIFEEMGSFALKIRTSSLTPELLFLRLLEEKAAQIFLWRGEINRTHLTQLLAAELKPGSGDWLQLTAEMEPLLLKSYTQALERKGSQITLPDLIAALSTAPKIQLIFQHLGLKENDLKLLLTWWQNEAAYRSPQLPSPWLRLIRPRRNLNLAWTAQATPTLDRFSQDLTELARLGFLPKAEVRQATIERAINILSRREKNNLILVGQAGVGKSSIIGGIALEMLKEKNPPSLRDKKLVALSTSQLVAEAGNLGGIAGALAKIIEEVAQAGNIVLYIPNTHLLASEKEGGIANIAGVLLPALQNNRFQLIGTSNPEEYRAFIENNEALAAVLEKVEVEELTPEQAIFVLTYLASLIESKQGVLMTLAAIKKAVELSVRYIHDRVLPDKAEDLLDEAAAQAARNQKPLVDAASIIQLMERKTKIPITTVTRAESQKLLNLEEEIHQRLIDQAEAVRAVSDALRRARSGLAPGKRPIGNFLFVGPTGVGKTELAKTLAAVYFGNEEAMIRLDMTEFKTTESIHRLIGAPLGQAGAEKGGLFTEAVRQKPFSLILLDELEKAAPNVRELFLQVMDDDRLTDSTGKQIDFTNSIIIATSNAGSQFIAEAIKKGQDYESMRRELIDNILLKIFSPEFLNRFDAVIAFKPLTLQEMTQIAQLRIRELAERLRTQNIELVVEGEALGKIARLGFDPVFGARPLKRVIQNKIENEIAKKLLAREIKEGDRVVIKADLI